MIPAKFDYVAPTSVEDALAALAESDDAKVIAGGQSLMPVLRMRLNAPELIVDIGKIDSLKSIVDEGDSVLIGAMVPYFQILADPSVQTGLGLLHKAIQLRCLHGAPRRPEREVVQRPCGAGQRERGDHDRGDRPGR